MTEFAPMQEVSSFRKMAAGMWSKPRDPSISGSMDIAGTAPLAFLAEHQHRTGVKLTITHLVARAVALALRDQPEINAKVRFWGRLEQRATVAIFAAVPAGARDLSGARIARADERSLVQLAQEIGGRARTIRDGKDPGFKK